MNPVQLFKLWRAWTKVQSAWKEYQVSKEPVMLGQLVAAGATIAALFGLDLSQEQVASIAVVASLVMGWIARARVSPVAK
jgi:hypothetical protein